jgi:hypothetical protein
VVEELTGELVTGRKVTIVDRRSLALIRQEMNLQLSGDVSDESAQAIGRMLGAQSIVSGSLTDMGTFHRFRVRVINVETAAIQTQVSLNLQKDTQVSFLLGGSAAAPSATASASPAAVPAQTPAPAAPTVYRVGDTGPAGGLIFYDKGNNSGGWRYLEAAPASTEGKDLQWSVSFFDTGAKGAEVGNGKLNTQNIMDASVQAAVLAAAARYCDRLQYGGYDDWYLPSKNELGLMYMNLKVDGLGGFGAGWYWSSTEASTNGAWAQQFSDGSQSSGGSQYRDGYKAATYSVRACRQF